MTGTGLRNQTRAGDGSPLRGHHGGSPHARCQWHGPCGRQRTPARCARLHARPTVCLNLDLPPLPRCPNLNLNAPARSPLKERKRRNGTSHGAFVRNMLAVLARAADGPGASASGQTTQAASLVRFWQRRLAQIATVYWYCRVESTSSNLSDPNAVTRRTEAAVTVAVRCPRFCQCPPGQH